MRRHEPNVKLSCLLRKSRSPDGRGARGGPLATLKPAIPFDRGEPAAVWPNRRACATSGASTLTVDAVTEAFMALIPCPTCTHRVSERALACPACGHPGPDISAGRGGGVARMLGQVAGTYISTTTLASLVLGCVMFVCVAAVLITLILSGH
jgi:hypothetical protein